MTNEIILCGLSMLCVRNTLALSYLNVVIAKPAEFLNYFFSLGFCDFFFNYPFTTD